MWAHGEDGDGCGAAVPQSRKAQAVLFPFEKVGLEARNEFSGPWR